MEAKKMLRIQLQLPAHVESSTPLYCNHTIRLPHDSAKSKEEYAMPPGGNN
jgi:hypothetical protein